MSQQEPGAQQPRGGEGPADHGGPHSTDPDLKSASGADAHHDDERILGANGQPARPNSEAGWGAPPASGRQPGWGAPPGAGSQPGWGTPLTWGQQPEWGGHASRGLQPGQQGTPLPPHRSPPYGQPRYLAPPKPGIVPLRPLMFGEILDGSFQTIRRNAKAMLGAAVLAQALAAILAAVITAVTATSLVSFEVWSEDASTANLAALGLGFGAAVLVVAVLTLFISAVLQGAMVVPVARSMLNRPTGFRQMWGLARSRAWALVRLAALMMAAGLLSFLVLAGMAVALVAGMEGTGALLLIPVVPAFFALFAWAYIKLMVAPAAVVIEELGALAGLRRSWSLTRGNWWRIFGITLVVGIMVGVIGQVVMIPVSLLPAFLGGVISPHGGAEQEIAIAIAVGVATAVLAALIGAVGYAFQTSVMALLYMDLRMRKDGLDLALLRLLETGANPEGIPGRGMAASGPGLLPRTGSGGAWPDDR